MKNVTLSESENSLFTLELTDPNMVFSVEVMNQFSDLLEKVGIKLLLLVTLSV